MTRQKANNADTAVRDGFMRHSKDLSAIFPSPAILESYEEIYPGIVEKLVTMVEKEQLHRQSLELKEARYGALAEPIALIIRLSVIACFGIMSIFYISSASNFVSGAAAVLICMLFLFFIVKCKKTSTKHENAQLKSTSHESVKNKPRPYRNYKPRGNRDFTNNRS